MIRPLLVYLQPKILPEVLEPLKKIPCDKLYVRFYPYPEPHRVAREFFLNHKEYTHLIILPNDAIATKEHYEKLIDDLQKHPFLEVISGVANVDMEENIDNLTACKNLPALNYENRRYYWIKRGIMQGINRVRHVGFSFTCIARQVIEEMKVDGRYGFDGVDPKKESLDGADLWFSNCCYSCNIPIYADFDIELKHLRYKGEMLVGKINPEIEFIPYKLSKEELKRFYHTSITVTKPLPLNLKLVEIILSNKPNSVFEFGANWGVNLKEIKQHDPNISCLGMDLSKVAINIAKNQQLEVLYGDERTLKEIPDNSKDIVFTCSCLNHIPDEAFIEIIRNLKRIAKTKVILVESNYGQGERWFNHDYISQGFKSINKIISEPFMIQFDYWEFVK